MTREIVILRGQRHELCECITCGVIYTCPEIVILKQRERGGYHHCPNGHSQGRDKNGSENAQLLRRAQRAEQEQARLAEELATANRRTECEVRERERMMKRATAGVCQCCKRSFANVARHMKLKHPNVVPLEIKSA